jgi:hypothetical protein
MLGVRGFRGHTISGRGFNLFKPLRRHLRANPLGEQRRDRCGICSAASATGRIEKVLAPRSRTCGGRADEWWEAGRRPGSSAARGAVPNGQSRNAAPWVGDSVQRGSKKNDNTNSCFSKNDFQKIRKTE